MRMARQRLAQVADTVYRCVKVLATSPCESPSSCGMSTPWYSTDEGAAILTEITAVVETVGTAAIADTLFALLELLEESKVTWNW